jgi:hypothetical protein
MVLGTSAGDKHVKWDYGLLQAASPQSPQLMMYQAQSYLLLNSLGGVNGLGQVHKPHIATLCSSKVHHEVVEIA